MTGTGDGNKEISLDRIGDTLIGFLGRVGEVVRVHFVERLSGVMGFLTEDGSIDKSKFLKGLDSKDKKDEKFIKDFIDTTIFRYYVDIRNSSLVGDAEKFE
jgi:hypothetical protein